MRRRTSRTVATTRTRSARSDSMSAHEASVRRRSSPTRPTAASRVYARGANGARAPPRSRHQRRRPVQQRRGFHALRSLHHPRRRSARSCRSSTATATRIVQAPGMRRDQLRDDPRHARHLRSTAAAHVGANIRQYWATRAAAGKATRSSSRRPTSRTGRASASTATACVTAPT